jgi:isopentenyl-diphosphate delta-isomerase
MSEIRDRKNDHLTLCAEGDVEHRGTTLLEQVHLLHDAIPDRSLDEIDLAVELFGRKLQAPILISSMTGGTPEAQEINHALASVAQKCGFAMGVGSQRAMLLHPELTDTYRIRDTAPDIPLLANIGSVQARDEDSESITEMIRSIGADALCIHLNVAQELTQSEGDRDFRGCLGAIGALVDELDVPVIVKETGCGLSPGVIGRLAACGIDWIDVAGAGGTSWTGVEALRGPESQQALGRALRDWGIPTAASVAYGTRAGLHTIASGGIRTGRDIANALALGADIAGLALPFLRAYTRGGDAELLAVATQLIEELRAITLLCGVPRASDLRQVPRVLGRELESWLELS